MTSQTMTPSQARHCLDAPQQQQHHLHLIEDRLRGGRRAGDWPSGQAACSAGRAAGPAAQAASRCWPAPAKQHHALSHSR